MRRVSSPMRHRTVEEIWFFLAGEGEVWRRRGQMESVVPVQSNATLTIPYQCEFQFRNTSKDQDLVFLIATIPGWPGPEEAVPVEIGHWVLGS